MNRLPRFIMGVFFLGDALLLLHKFSITGNLWVAVGALMCSGSSVAILGSVLRELLWPKG